jgi:hypothetical protein
MKEAVTGIVEGPCMEEGQARERCQASVAWKAMDRFLHEWTAGQEPVQQVLRTGREGQGETWTKRREKERRK